MSAEEELLELLRSLPEKNFNTELDLTREVVPSLVSQLGYSESETFYEYAAGQWRADVALSNAAGDPPWVILEIKRSKALVVGDWVYQLKRYQAALNCDVGAIVSPELFVLVVGGVTKKFILRSISLEDARQIFATLKRGAQTLPKPGATQPAGKLVELIEAIERATTAADKGSSLESLARFLFNSVPSLRAKYCNLQTRSSEIDIVVEYLGNRGEIPIFEELGRYCLVECKNWSKPVGVTPVRDFMGKLDKCKTRLGIIFSRNGVTGVDSGADALREIHSRFDRDGVYLLIFSLEELKGIAGGLAFVEAIEKKANGLRFDSANC